LNELIPKKLNAPKLPFCWTCYDLGNYEVSTFSDGHSIPKWYYSEVRIQDMGKQYAENNNVEEVSIHRQHCGKCHARFVDEHHRLVSLIKDERSNAASVSESRHDLAFHWGLKSKRKQINT